MLLMFPQKLILIGFMGSGKSTVAPLLAASLGFSAVDADEKLLRISGHSSIKEIFSKSDESYFRELEANVAASFREASSVVIAAGGGVINRPENMDHLTHNGGFVVFLNTSFDEIRLRVRDVSSRPLFKDGNAAEKLYHSRLPTYRKYAHLIVDTDGKTAEDVCSEILSSLKEKR